MQLLIPTEQEAAHLCLCCLSCLRTKRHALKPQKLYRACSYRRELLGATGVAQGWCQTMANITCSLLPTSRCQIMCKRRQRPCVPPSNPDPTRGPLLQYYQRFQNYTGLMETNVQQCGGHHVPLNNHHAVVTSEHQCKTGAVKDTRQGARSGTCSMLMSWRVSRPPRRASVSL